MDIKRNQLVISLFSGALAIFMSACRSHSEVVYRTKVMNSKIGFYVSENPDYRKGEGKFFARVDNSNSLIYYSFQPNYIYKTYPDRNNYVYTLVSDGSEVRALTPIDSAVLRKADQLMDSLGIKNLKRSAGFTGFIVEVSGH